MVSRMVLKPTSTMASARLSRREQEGPPPSARMCLAFTIPVPSCSPYYADCLRTYLRRVCGVTVVCTVMVLEKRGESPVPIQPAMPSEEVSLLANVRYPVSNTHHSASASDEYTHVLTSLLFFFVLWNLCPVFAHLPPDLFIHTFPV